jgi:hypothetical protein
LAIEARLEKAEDKIWGGTEKLGYYLGIDSAVKGWLVN